MVKAFTAYTSVSLLISNNYKEINESTKDPHPLIGSVGLSFTDSCFIIIKTLLMGRLLAIDYGRKRCGIAVTDTLRICANGLTTVRAYDLMSFLKEYCAKEPVDMIIVGLPRQMDGTPSESTRYIDPFLKQLRREMPDMLVERYDERFTSTLAHRAMLDGGLHRMARRDKELVDVIAATIILNDYLSARH